MVTEQIVEYIQKQPVLRKNRERYADCVCAFDIETSPIKHKKQAFIYSWQFAANDCLLIGRTVKELRNFILKLTQKMKRKIIVFVHNLSYEFSFLKTLFKFDDVLAVRKRRILTATYKNIEFRCSYLLSNMSLDRYLQKWNVDNQKATMRYDIMRYSWTHLLPDDYTYISNDVLGLTQAIRKEIVYEQLKLTTLPLTSTGYVRRELKKALRPCKDYIKSLHLPMELLLLAQECFRGGNTHANRFKAGKIIENVRTKDINSSYPRELQESLFPVDSIWESMASLEECGGRPFMARFRFTNIRLKRILNPAPYISLSKTRGPRGYLLDNGRVLGAETIEISLTDLDWNIVREDYIWDEMQCWDIYANRYGLLPDGLCSLVEHMYEQKTSLKGEDEYMYNKYKNLINSLYGACVQNPLQNNYQLKYSMDKRECLLEEMPGSENDLAEFYSAAAVPYIWGVWVTAWARTHLQAGIRLVGDDFVYCDTDSVKYTGDYDFSALNNPCAFYATDKGGRRYYLGHWDSDPDYKRFITWGAKKYAYEFLDGRVGVTIAGVNKVEGARYLAAHGGLEALKPGFIFKNAGGMAVQYNDVRPADITLCNGKTIEMLSSAYLFPVSYQLTLSNDYINQLFSCNDLANYKNLFAGYC